MATNSELDEFRELMNQYLAAEEEGGVLAAITFQSELDEFQERMAEADAIEVNSQLSLDQGLAGLEVSQNTQIAKSGPDSEKSSEVIDDRK